MCACGGCVNSRVRWEMLQQEKDYGYTWFEEDDPPMQLPEMTSEQWLEEEKKIAHQMAFPLPAGRHLKKPSTVVESTKPSHRMEADESPLSINARRAQAVPHADPDDDLYDLGLYSKLREYEWVMLTADEKKMWENHPRYTARERYFLAEEDGTLVPEGWDGPLEPDPPLHVCTKHKDLEVFKSSTGHLVWTALPKDTWKCPICKLIFWRKKVKKN
jgi:hypothetical protein